MELSFDEKEFIHLSVHNTHTIIVNKTDKATKIEGSPASLKMITFRKQNNELQAKHFGQLKADMEKAMKANDQKQIDELQKQAEPCDSKLPDRV